MGTLADRLDDMRVRAGVPGIDIWGELRERNQVLVSFGAGVYHRLTDADLERHMTSLARLVFAARVRAYHLVIRDEFPAKIIGDSTLETPADRAYDAARQDLVARGESRDGRVAIKARGLREWQVTIANGTVRALNEGEFAQRAREAVAALFHDQVSQTRELKQRFFD